MSESESKWELVVDWKDQIVGFSRIKVDGGHVYRQIVASGGTDSVSLCFVPDVDLKRYESHLRDAYRQRYVAGHEDSKRGVEEKFEG